MTKSTVRTNNAQLYNKPGFAQLVEFSMERAGEAIFWVDRNANILFVNEKACQALGYSRDELTRMRIPDIDPNFPIERWPSHWKELKEKGAFLIETLHRRKDGTVFPAEVTVNYFEFKGEEYNCAFARDITERKAAEENLARRDEQLEILSRTSVHVNTVLEIPKIMRTLVAAAIELAGADGGMAGLFSGGKMIFDEYNKGGKIYPVKEVLGFDYTAPAWSMDSKRPFIYNGDGGGTSIASRVAKAKNVYNLVNIPIISRNGELLGCIEIHNKRDGKTFDSQDIFMLQGLAASAAVALENARAFLNLKKTKEALKADESRFRVMNERLKQLALKDPQTGLYNYQYLTEVIDSEFYRARRYGHPLSVVMIDVDYFKSINDVYGRDFGDLILKQLGSQLKKMVRRYDTVVRSGGEEFVIISPGVDRKKSLLLAQRLLDALNLYSFGNKNHAVKLKLSISVSSYPEDSINKGMDLISLADKILDKVKEKGGNRTYSSADISKAKPQPPEMGETNDIKFLKKKIDALTKRGKQGLIESIFAFAKTIELKDHYTGEHAENTVRYSTQIATALDLSPEETENIRQASTLHDLGKIGISDKILLKRAKLTKKEFAQIKKHPQIAADIIRPIQFMHDIIPLILYHHERWDGKGYPSGLKGEEIPIGARIIAIADVYQALTSNRPYRKAYPQDKALEIIKKGAGTQFDPRIVDVFLKIVKKERNHKNGKSRRRK